MQRGKWTGIAVLVVVATLMIATGGCFGSPSPAESNTPEEGVVKPNPKVVSVIATTSGTEKAYYAILDITVKNEGAEGTILVVATVTQDGKSSQNEMDVYLKQGRSHELKLTFPLVWKGGKWTADVQALVP